jgi:hypothetical protein
MNNKSLLTLGLVSLLAVATQASQEQLATSIKDARLEATRTSDLLKSTLNTLNALTKQKEGDLRSAYNAFAANVPKTEAAAAWAGTYTKWMAADGQQYFKNWQKTIDGIANEGLRKKSQKRLDDVRKSYSKVEAALIEAGDKFKPFLSDLNDVRKALANDVTAGGVKAIKSTVSSANWNYAGVSKGINDALKEMAKMEGLLSTQAK